jgi:hypothetical protein
MQKGWSEGEGGGGFFIDKNLCGNIIHLQRDPRLSETKLFI